MELISTHKDKKEGGKNWVEIFFMFHKYILLIDHEKNTKICKSETQNPEYRTKTLKIFKNLISGLFVIMKKIVVVQFNLNNYRQGYFCMIKKY